MKLYYPKIFTENATLSAFFSSSNRRLINKEGTISGLNLGYNTNAPEEEIDQNFAHLFSELNWDRNKIALANQVHQTDVRYVTKPGIYDNTDGFITDIPGLSLGIRVADCAAMLVGDPINNVIGAFHAGWKGAAGGIIPKGIEEMSIRGADTKHILVYISPCISLKNFEVGEEVAKLFPDRFVDRKSFQKPHVDLKGFILWQLLNAGIDQTNIEVSTKCTVDDSELYSYRRERDQAGRMLGLIKINE